MKKDNGSKGLKPLPRAQSVYRLDGRNMSFLHPVQIVPSLWGKSCKMKRVRGFSAIRGREEVQNVWLHTSQQNKHFAAVTFYYYRLYKLTSGTLCALCVTSPPRLGHGLTLPSPIIVLKQVPLYKFCEG